MASKLDIYNGALANIGEEKLIDDPDSETPGRALRVLRALLPQVTDTIVRYHPWLSCTRRRTLSKLNAGPLEDWNYNSAYVLTPDWRRIWAVDSGHAWERGKAEERNAGGDLVGRRDVILSNETASTLRAVLIELVPYEDMDAALTNAITWALASKAAGPLQADKPTQKMAREEAAEALAQGVAAETSEFGNQPPEFESAWILAHEGGGCDPATGWLGR